MCRDVVRGRLTRGHPPARRLHPGRTRARTSSRTRTAASSTSARPRACAAGCRTTSPRRTRCCPRTRQMVQAAETVEWIEVRNEVEALFLEYNLIKEHRPRFNIRLKDDKSYPFLAVTLDEEWPRAMVMRGKKRKGVRYFGPYAHAYAIRETLDLLLRTFPIRTCTNGKFQRHQRLGRPCLYAHIEKCVAPCVDAVTDDGVPRPRRRAALVPRRRDRARHQPARDADGRGGRRARVRAGRPPARPARLGPQGDRAPADGGEADRGARRHRDRRRRARGVGADLLRPARPGRRPQGPHRRQGRGPRPARARRPRARAALRRRRAGRRAEGGARPVPARRTRSSTRSSSVSCAAARSTSASRSAAQKRALLETVVRNARRRSTGTSSSARPTTTRAPRRSPRCRRRSSCPRRRCASSASTSRTCRAPRSSRR